MRTQIQGRCPACDWSGSIFVGDGGYLTCSRDTCPNPCAPSEALGVKFPAEATGPVGDGVTEAEHLERLQRQRDQALAEVERLKAENADLRRGRITAHVHTWAEGQPLSDVDTPEATSVPPADSVPLGSETEGTP